ncbi:MAG: metal-dependent hydrolase [Flavobacteriales bacterium]
MDILIHTLSGMSVTTVAAAWIYERRRDRFKLIALGAFAGALPDVDALSMWSGFDGTFGKWFSLEATGRDIYRGSYWYSHHAFMHSFLASVFLPSLFIGVLSAIRKRPQSHLMWKKGLVFTLAFNAHLAGDLPTPSGAWDGIAYFYPSQQYIGGYGLTHWWNNYDIFLILLLCVATNVVLLVTIKRRHWTPTAIAVVATVLCVVQLNRRNFDFNSKEYTHEQRNAKSLELQREYLGETVCGWMERFDKSLPVNF